MSFVVREITKRAGGGEIVRPVKHDVPLLTVGRSSDNIIPLADLAVLPHHATIAMREGQVHVEALGGSPLEIDGKFTNRADLDVAKPTRITVGSHRLTLERDAASGDVTITVERVAALSEGVQADDEEKIFSLTGAMPGKRRLAWGFLAAVLALFLAWPVTAYFMRSAEAPTIRADQPWLSGPLSAAHASLKDDCKSCHVDAFVAVKDETCTGCHTKLADHADPKRLLAAHPDVGLQAKLRSTVGGAFGLQEWTCTGCHKEHEGAAAMPLTAESFCADCHRNLTKDLPDTKLLNASDFKTDHPEFRPEIVVSSTWDGPTVRQMSIGGKPREGSGLKFPHKLHLAEAGGVAQMARRLGTVESGGLDCGNCHAPDATGVRFRDIEMERDCGDCHTLEFAQSGGTVRTLRHGDSKQVVAELRDYYRGGGGGFASSMGSRVDGRQRPGAAGVRPAAVRGGASVESRIRAVFAEGGACGDCHVVKMPPPGSLDFEVSPVVLRDRYMARAWFDHRDHDTKVTDCVTCHKADASDRASDLLLPGIAVCRDCHVGAHPEAGKLVSTCASCHSYHESPGAPRVLKPVGADRAAKATTDEYKSRNDGGARATR